MGLIDSLPLAKKIVLTPKRKPEAKQNELPKIKFELPNESKYVITIPK